MAERYRPQDQMVISDLETLKVLSDPFRVRILEQMAQRPVPIKQVADNLGVSPNKLYYHVKMMEEHGLITVVEQKIISGIIENWYQVSACHYRIDNALFLLSPDTKGEHLGQLVDNILQSTREDVMRGIRSNLITYEKEGDDSHRMILSRMAGCMAHTQHALFREKLLALIDEFMGEEDACEGDDSQAYILTVLLYPYDPRVGDDEGMNEEVTDTP